MFKSFCLVFGLLVFSECAASATKRLPLESNVDRQISRTLISLERLADFYVKNIDNINLDSVYGLRIAEGSLSTVLEKLRHADGLENRYFTRIKALSKTIKRAATEVLLHLKEYEPDYFDYFKPTIEKAWMYFKDFRTMGFKTGDNSSFVSEGSSGSVSFQEKVSDRCMTQIMGTASGQKKSCYVSTNCLMLMTSDKLHGYGNTHQVLYFLLGFENGCRDILERKIKHLPHLAIDGKIANVDGFLQQKCGQIFKEMEELKDNVVSRNKTDLFLEQGAVCGILGFEDFLSHDILQDIFNWQDDEYGCFGTEYLHQVRNNKKNGYESRRFIARVTMRKLLYDRTLSNGCSSHETGVATGLLSIYLRWLTFSKVEK